MRTDTRCCGYRVIHANPSSPSSSLPVSPCLPKPFSGEKRVPEPTSPALPTTMVPEVGRTKREQRRVSSAWEQERSYLCNPSWCEHRVVLLFQEAFLPHYRRAKQARDDGLMSREDFTASCAEIREALRCIKCEYRRTLQRLRDRNASNEELAGLAAKAVACVASVYPWSSDGFLLPYHENLLYSQLSSPTSPERTSEGQDSDCVAPPPPPPPTPLSLTQKPTPSSTVVPSTGMRTAKGGPRPTLQPLPIRKDGFTRSIASDGSVVLSSASPQPRDPSISSAAGFSPPPHVAEGYISRFASPLTTPGSPQRQLPPSITGPVRPEEMRFLERKQLVQTSCSFSARSLAAVPFVAMRRSAIAQRQATARLASAVLQGPTTPLSAVTTPECACVAATPTAPAYPQAKLHLHLTPQDASVSSEVSPTMSEGSLGSRSTLSQRGRRDSFSDTAAVADVQPACYAADRAAARARTPPPSPLPVARQTVVPARSRDSPASYCARQRRSKPMTPQEELIVKSLW